MKGDLNIIGDAVRKYRKAKKWTLPKLAVECQLLGWQVIRETLIKIEHGTRRVVDSEVLILARVLDCTPADLIGDDLDAALANARHSKLED